MYKEIIEKIKPELDKTIAFLERELSKLRTGRASISLVENIVVDCFGASRSTGMLGKFCSCFAVRMCIFALTGYRSSVQADHFVFLDDVQLARQSWQTRNRIRSADGRELMQSIPVRHDGRLEIALHEVELDDSQPWRLKHGRSVQQAYAFLGEMTAEEARLAAEIRALDRLNMP